MASSILKKCAGGKDAPLVLDERCILVPGLRRDGVGIQAMLRICVMFLARQANAIYIHMPFMMLAHQDVDPDGRTLSAEEWSIEWESFFNFGKDEYNIADLVDATGEAAVVKHMSARHRHFGDPMDTTRGRLPAMVDRIRNHAGDDCGIYTFNLGLCRQPRECGLFLDQAFIRDLQKKFEANGYRPGENLYSEQFLNVAIHIRRGDVWDACQTGSKVEMYTNKLVSEDFYVALIGKLHNLFITSPRPVRFHIFSDGKQEIFERFTFTGEREAFLKLESGLLIDNIQFHLRQNTFDTLYHLIKAPVLVPGKSTFSVVAVLLGNSCVLYEDEIHEFYQYDLLEEYMRDNPRFVSLTGLEDRTDELMQQLGNILHD